MTVTFMQLSLECTEGFKLSALPKMARALRVEYFLAFSLEQFLRCGQFKARIPEYHVELGLTSCLRHAEKVHVHGM
jgi:hypothetical protein